MAANEFKNVSTTNELNIQSIIESLDFKNNNEIDSKMSSLCKLILNRAGLENRINIQLVR